MAVEGENGGFKKQHLQSEKPGRDRAGRQHTFVAPNDGHEASVGYEEGQVEGQEQKDCAEQGGSQAFGEGWFHNFVSPLSFGVESACIERAINSEPTLLRSFERVIAIIIRYLGMNVKSVL